MTGARHGSTLSGMATGVSAGAITLDRVRRLCRGRDVALGYSLIVVAVAVTLAVAPRSVHDELVLRSSTNLNNLRHHPIHVLVPRHWRAPYVTVLAAILAVALVLFHTFTDVGHVTAWAIGLGLAVIVSGARRPPVADGREVAAIQWRVSSTGTPTAATASRPSTTRRP